MVSTSLEVLCLPLFFFSFSASFSHPRFFAWFFYPASRLSSTSSSVDLRLSTDLRYVIAATYHGSACLTLTGGLRTASRESRAASCKLRTTNYKLRTTNRDTATFDTGICICICISISISITRRLLDEVRPDNLNKFVIIAVRRCHTLSSDRSTFKNTPYKLRLQAVPFGSPILPLRDAFYHGCQPPPGYSDAAAAE